MADSTLPGGWTVSDAPAPVATIAKPLPGGWTISDAPVAESKPSATPAGMAQALAEGKGDMPSFGDVQGRVATTAKPLGPTSVTAPVQAGGETTQVKAETPATDREESTPQTFDLGHGFTLDSNGTVHNANEPTWMKEGEVAEQPIVKGVETGMLTGESAAKSLGNPDVRAAVPKGIMPAFWTGMDNVVGGIASGLDHLFFRNANSSVSKYINEKEAASNIPFLQKMGNDGLALHHILDNPLQWIVDKSEADKQEIIDKLDPKVKALVTTPLGQHTNAAALVFNMTSLGTNFAASLLMGRAEAKAIGDIADASLVKIASQEGPRAVIARNYLARVQASRAMFLAGAKQTLSVAGMSAADVEMGIKHLTPEQYAASSPENAAALHGKTPDEQRNYIDLRAEVAGDRTFMATMMLSLVAMKIPQEGLAGEMASNAMYGVATQTGENVGKKETNKDQPLTEGDLTAGIVSGLAGTLVGRAGKVFGVGEKEGGLNEEKVLSAAKRKALVVKVLAARPDITPEQRADLLKKADVIDSHVEAGNAVHAGAAAGLTGEELETEAGHSDKTDKFKDAISDTIKRYINASSDDKDKDRRIANVQTLDRWAQANGGRTPTESLVAFSNLIHTGELSPEIKEWANEQDQGHAAAENEKPNEGAGNGNEADQVGPAADEGAKPVAGEERPASQVVTPRSQPVIDRLGQEGVKADVKANGRVVVPPNEEGSEQAIKIAANDSAESPENDRREPTPAQKAQGNYPKGRIVFTSPKGDIPVDIENPAGSIRKSLPGTKPAWSRKMTEHYGNIPGTYSKDGEPVDVIVGRKAHDDELPIFVMQQTAKDGTFDEHKVVMGARSEREARDMYLKQYPQSMHDELLQGQTKMVRFNRPQFMDWMKSGDHDVPLNPMSKRPLLSLREPNGRLDAYFKKGTEYDKLDETANRLNTKFGTNIEVRPEGAGYRLSGEVPKAKVPSLYRSLKRVDGHDQTEFNGQPAGDVYPRPSREADRQVPAQRAGEQADRSVPAGTVERKPAEDRQARSGRGDVREGVSGSQETPKPPRWLKKVKTTAPAYAKGKGRNPVSVVGVNYSTTPNLKALDTAFAGTGSPGAEVRRFGLGRPTTADKHRMYFYARQSNELPVKEPVVRGEHAYEARLDNLYDIHGDPDGIMERLDRAGTRHADAVEAAVKRAGYDGIVAKGVASDVPVVQLIGKHIVPVKEVMGGRYSMPLEAEAPKPEPKLPDTVEGRFYGRLGMDAKGNILDRGAFDQAVHEYKELPESFGGRVVSVDSARELSSDYLKDRSLSGDVHEPASSFAKHYYAEKLAEPKGKNPSVLFMSGGTGAGKTTLVREMERSGEELPDVVYDTNTSSKASAIRKIDQALESGRNVRIGYIYRDPVDAFEHGAVKRAVRQAAEYGTGRTVPMNAHVQTHVGSLETFKALREHYAGDDRVSFKLFENGSSIPFRQVDIDKLDNFVQSRQNIGYAISNKLNELRSNGIINEDIYHGFRKVSPSDPALEGEAGAEGAGSGAEGSEGSSEKEVTQLSWEAVPSTKLPFYRWITDMPTGMRSDYTRDVNEAIGKSILEAHGLKGAAQIGYGGWEGGVNPSVQVRLRNAPEAAVRAAAQDFGYATRQDGVAYHRAIPETDLEKSNGTNVDIGRPLSAEETRNLYSKLTDKLVEAGVPKEDAQQIAPIPTPRGVRFLNFTDAQNPKVYEAVKSAVAETIPDDATVGHFRSEGDLLTNDWKENPDGQGYRRGSAAKGSSDLQGGVADHARALVDDITERYRQEAIRQGFPVRTAEESAAHVKDIQTHVDSLREAWRGAPEVKVVATAKELPAPIASHLETALGPDSGAEAVYYGGKVYLIGDSIRDKAHAEYVTAHETLGHYGLRATFGDELDNLLSEIHDSVKDSPEFRELERRYGSAYAGMDARERANALTEEFLSDKAAMQVHPGIVSRVAAWMRGWGRRLGLVSRWNENDVLNLMDGVARNVREGRASRAGLPSETATHEADLTTTQSYRGAAGEGQITFRPDGDRTLQIGTLKADLSRVWTESGLGLQVDRASYDNPAQLLAITRLAGEEGKGYLVWPSNMEGALRDAGVPTERLGQAILTPASRLPPGEARFSVQSQPADPQLRDRINRVMGLPESSMTPWDRMQHKLRSFLSREEAVRLKDSAMYGMVDRFNYIAKMERKLTGGTLLDAMHSAWKMAWMSQNTREATGAVMQLGVPEYRDGAFQPVAGRKGLFQIFSPLSAMDDPSALRQWEFYAIARRSDQLQHMLNRDGTSKEKLLTADDIKAGLALGEKNPVFKQVFDDWQEFNKNLLDLAVERGNMTKEMADLWKQNDYVPFYRISEDDPAGKTSKMIGGLAVKSKRLTGSNSKIEPVIENIVNNTQSVISKVYRNEALRRTASIGQLTGDIERMPMAFRPVNMSVGEIESNLEKMGMFVGQQGNAARGAKLSLTPAQSEMWTRFFRAQAPVGDDVFSVMENGKPIYYKVNDPDAARSLKDIMGKPALNNWYRMIFGAPKNFLTHAITLNPAFMLRHLERQMAHTWIQSGENFNPLSHALQGAHDAYTNSEFMQRMQMAGSGGNEYYPIDEVRESLRGMGTHSTLLDSGHKLWMAYRKIGYVADQMNRMSIARQVLARGGSTAEAAWQAQDLLNFRMQGGNTAMRYLVGAVPFLNARIQGLYRIERGALGIDQSYKARSKAVASFIMKSGAFMAASTLLALHNEGDPRYERLPDQVKNNYWNMFVGNEHFAIAKPFEMGALLSTLPESIMRYAQGYDGTGTFKKNMMRVLETVFRMDPIPAIASPVIQDLENKDQLTQFPIVPEAQQKLEPAEQENPYTSPSIEAVAHAMPEFAPDALRSPLRLQHLVNGYVGSLGTYAILSADSLMRATGHAPAWPAGRMPGGSVVNAAFGGMASPADTDPRNRYVDMIYQDKAKLDQITETMNNFRKQGAMDELNTYYLQHKNAAQYRAQIMAAYKTMQEYNNEQRAIYSNPQMTPEEKRTKLDELTKDRNRVLENLAPMLNLVDSGL